MSASNIGGSSVRVREAPSSESKTVAFLLFGTPVTVADVLGEWRLIRLENASVPLGYVHQTLLAEGPDVLRSRVGPQLKDPPLTFRLFHHCASPTQGGFSPYHDATDGRRVYLKYCWPLFFEMGHQAVADPQTIYAEWRTFLERKVFVSPEDWVARTALWTAMFEPLSPYVVTPSNAILGSPAFSNIVPSRISRESLLGYSDNMCEFSTVGYKKRPFLPDPPPTPASDMPGNLFLVGASLLPIAVEQLLQGVPLKPSLVSDGKVVVDFTATILAWSEETMEFVAADPKQLVYSPSTAETRLEPDIQFGATDLLIAIKHTESDPFLVNAKPKLLRKETSPCNTSIGREKDRRQSFDLGDDGVADFVVSYVLVYDCAEILIGRLDFNVSGTWQSAFFTKQVASCGA